ncbi:MAG: SDR family NAD(P)-dependent oxidoreductase [Halothiobacillus sp.]|jgi:NAD(P)-dependent dehydrogenase (short-subunit alcohol dehydrogenase family)|nr:SDR family NAD(P)-dependent oxidoreductase [Halothiobacillus sp.]
MPNLDHSRQRVTWIVGGSSGIGRALAEGLLLQGDRVVVSARHLEGLADLAERYGDQVQLIAVDVTEPETLDKGLSELLARWARIDRVILNAADYSPMSLADFDPALFERLMQINFMGVIHGINAVRQQFLQQGAGQILITASVAGFRGLPYAAPYGATKAALINMAESLAPEFARNGVLLRVINPGFVRTALTAKNDFEMPGILEPEEAARLILKKLDRRGFELLVPTGFGLVMKLIRILPYPLFFALTRRMLKP